MHAGLLTHVNMELITKGNIKGALEGLREFLASESPLKKMKNASFTLKTLFGLKIFKFLSCLFGHVGKRLD